MDTSKLLLPYVPLLGDNGNIYEYRRWSICGKTYYGAFYSISINENKRSWKNDLTFGNDGIMGVYKPFPTVEAAKEDLDKQLLEGGYTLLTQEQADKLRLLI
jgi:hypothetical protein